MIRIGADVKEGDILLVKSLQKEKQIHHQKKNFYVLFLVTKQAM
jgi:hypothetical protein